MKRKERIKTAREKKFKMERQTDSETKAKLGCYTRREMGGQLCLKGQPGGPRTIGALTPVGTPSKFIRIRQARGARGCFQSNSISRSVEK